MYIHTNLHNIYSHVQDYPSVVEELDLVEEEDQFTHTVSLDDEFNPVEVLSECGTSSHMDNLGHNCCCCCYCLHLWCMYVILCYNDMSWCVCVCGLCRCVSV